MDTLTGRDLQAAAAGSWDLLVIGGGIQGATLALEAARRGLSTLLVERGDFGGETTAASLRIVHGGLRYLQGLDLARHRESVAERRWLLREFPDLVEPLPCLLPLYSPPRGGRLRRSGPFRAAFAVDALLARERGLPRGRLLGPAETVALFPGVDREGLRGAALWHDAAVRDPRKLVSELLRRARDAGARALDHVEAAELRVEDGRARGARLVDGESGRSFEVRAGAVASCAGPWVRDVARRCGGDAPELFHPMLAFNLLLDREPLWRGAVAVASRRPGAQTWFLVPGEGKLLAGTAYAPGEPGEPGEPLIAGFLRELNEALPGFDLRREQVARVLWGVIPATAAGSTVPASRPVIHDHGRSGGPRGLVSVSGVKLTTARAVSERALQRLVAPDVETASEGYARRFAGEVGKFFLDVQAAKVLELLSPWPEARVLDVGGGHAQLAGPLAERGYRVTVTGSAAVCRERLGREFAFEVCDADRLPFPDRSFDAVIAVRLLTHLERWREALAEMCRVARRAVIVDYPDTRSFNRLYGALFTWKKAFEGNTREFHCFRPGEVSAELARHGFGRPAARRQLFVPMVVHRAVGRAGFSRGIERGSGLLGLTRAFGSPVVLRVQRRAEREERA